MEDRLQFRFILATNAEPESMLAEVDWQTRLCRGQRTSVTGGNAVDHRNHTIRRLQKEYSKDDPIQVATIVETARKERIAREKLDKQRTRDRKARGVQKILDLKTKKARREAAEAERQERNRKIDLVEDKDEIGQLELPRLQEQARAWVARRNELPFKEPFIARLMPRAGLVGRTESKE
eukprot:COSAG05_NODE_9908_length_594_cov_0.987879_1_plen_178_part_10